MKRYLECGKIVSTHGIRGELRVQPWCDGPEYLCGFGRLYLSPEGKEPVEVERARPHKHLVILKLKGVESIDEAVTLRGRVLYIDREDDPEGGHFIQDLLGLEVLDADTGKSYGKLADVIATGANDVYAVRDGEGRERLVPAIPQVVLAVDIQGGVMKIRPLAGLFDEE